MLTWGTKKQKHTLPDYKQHSNVLESMIIKLYSKGVTTREIAALIEKMYGSHYSQLRYLTSPSR